MWKRRDQIIVALSLFILMNTIHLNLANENRNLSQALGILVQQAFINDEKMQHVLFFLNFDKNATSNSYIINYLTNKVLQNIHNATYVIWQNTQKQYGNFEYNQVVLLDNINTFKYFLTKLDTTSSKNLARTLLFISSLQTPDYDAMSLIFQNLYMSQMTRVSLLISLTNNDIVLLTYFPFTHTSCREFTPVIINRYLADQHRWENNTFFPAKADNFYGCPIYCCTWNDMPYFGVMPDKNNVSVTNYVGFEAELLKFIALSLNATIEIRWLNVKKLDFLRNESLISTIFSQNCDAVLGAFDYEPNLQTTTYSQTNSHSFNHIHLVTNVINLYRQYEKLASPFSHTVWFVLGLTYALSSLLICICGRQRKWLGYRNFLIGSANKTPHLNFYALGVGNNMTMTQMPKRNFARFILICWILLMFILRTAYQSGMYQMLRDNTQWKAPQTIDSVFERKYLISMTLENRKYLKVLPPTQRVRLLNATVLEVFTKVMNAKEPMAFLTSDSYFHYFAKTNGAQWHKLHLVKERFMSQQITIYVRHRSYLLRVINKNIAYAQNHGFTSMWRRKTNLLRETPISYATELPLSMRELGAIFMILLWLQTLAFAIFLIELMWHRYENIRKKIFYCK